MAGFVLMGSRFKRCGLPIPSSDHLSWHGINANSAWEAHQLDPSKAIRPKESVHVLDPANFRTFCLFGIAIYCES